MTPQEFWAYGSAGETLAEQRTRTHEVYRIHGLQRGETLTISPTRREVGLLAQTVAPSGDTTTVTRGT
jgi:hypothetical protein